ncbi:hypothetical protein LC653_00475 [Nostoc sp. CHAB 5784]|uniref:hypothetical protein n=1 Tax=Nostoc mirabile TaxID=2907820 RepID=UPI001E63EF9F|nr:hypothetical protein [Nostoc mirabile]MCC5662445.1 hypothetical protein [Nostoc mirabile CHAB5784]
MQTILSNFGKKVKFLQPSHIQRGNRQRGTKLGAEGKEVIFIFYSLFCPLPPAFIDKYAHLSWDVNENEKIMQFDERAIIQPTINLRFLVSKNTKSCDGELACCSY